MSLAACETATWLCNVRALILLEALQAFTPDRTAYLPAVLYGGGGALVAALLAELFIRAWTLRASEGRAIKDYFGASGSTKRDVAQLRCGVLQTARNRAQTRWLRSNN